MLTGPCASAVRAAWSPATFATDKREAVYFDAELARLNASLSKALPACR
jgi:hypothetical protein